MLNPGKVVMDIEKTNRHKKLILLTIFIGALLGVGYVYYQSNIPHIDVQAQEADVSANVSGIVNEYLLDEKAANEKYLSADGNSKIFIVKGIVKSKGIDMNDQVLVLLQGPTDRAGVKCVFMTETNKRAEALHIGQLASIKGIIRAGAKYDNDLQLYEHVLLEKCDVTGE